MLCISLSDLPPGQKYVRSPPWTVGTLTCFIAQKNKATSYHLGQLKAKLAKLRRELISPTGGGGGAGGVGFDVARSERLVAPGITYSSVLPPGLA